MLVLVLVLHSRAHWRALCLRDDLLDKPFRVGQFINVGSVWATVEKIGVRSTHLRNLRGELIVTNPS